MGRNTGLVRVITEEKDDSDPPKSFYTMDKVKEIPGSRLLYFCKLTDDHCPFDRELVLACLRTVEKEEKYFFGWEMHQKYMEAEVAGNLELIAAQVKAELAAAWSETDVAIIQRYDQRTQGGTVYANWHRPRDMLPFVEGETERENLVRSERQKHLLRLAANLEKWQLAAKNYLAFSERDDQENRHRGPVYKYKEEIKTLKRTLKEMQGKLQYAEFHLDEKRAQVKNASVNDVELQLSEEKKTTADLQTKNVGLHNEITSLRAKLNKQNEDLDLAGRKMEKAQMVITSMKQSHQLEVQSAHLKGILIGKDSAGTLATLEQLCQQPMPTSLTPLDDSFGSVDSMFNQSDSI